MQPVGVKNSYNQAVDRCRLTTTGDEVWNQDSVAHKQESPDEALKQLLESVYEQGPS